MTETVFSNARIVLADEVVTGSVRAVDGKIVAIDPGTASAGEDFEGDYLIPGLVASYRPVREPLSTAPGRLLEHARGATEP